MAGRTLTVQILGDSRSLEASFRKAGNSATGFGKTTDALGGKLRKFAKIGAAGAAAGGVAALGKGLSSSIQAAKDAQAAQARLEQAMTSSGVSFKRYGGEIDAAVQKTSKLAAIDDEELSDSFAQLLRTTGSVAKATKGMALAANIARGRNISLSAATKYVEKAQLGQVASLRRIGVQASKVTETEEAVKGKYEALAKTLDGGLTPALEAKMKVELENAKATDVHLTRTRAMEEAQRKFAGASERYGKTAAGAQERFSIALENLQERIGEKLLPVLAGLAEWGVRFLTWSEKNWPRLEQAIAKVVAAIKPILDNIARYFEGLVKIVKGIIQGDWSLVWAGLKQSVKAAVSAVIEALKLLVPRLFNVGVSLGGALARGIIEGLGNIGNEIANKLIPFGDPAGKFAGIKRDLERRQQLAPAAGIRGTNIPRAAGGPVAPFGRYLVGEGGPEVLQMGSRGGNVIPNHAFGGVTINGNIVLPGVTNPRQFLAELQRIAGQHASQQRGRYGGATIALG